MGIKRVALIGCGRWVRDSHLPALRRFADQIKLTHVVDLPQREKNVRHTLSEAGFDGESIVFVGAGRDPLPPKGAIDASIIATDPANHLQYLQWSLAMGLPTLADKPLTFHPNASTDPDQARKIAQDYEELFNLALVNNVRLFMLGTQKRYQKVFQDIAGSIKVVKEKTGYPVTFVSCLTSDGYWLLPEEYASGLELEGRLFHSYNERGGKLIHTGYHFIDIVPWLMRFAAPSNIVSAWVTTDLFRPADSVAANSADHLAKFLPGYQGNKMLMPEGLGDINAQITVKLCDANGRQVSIINYSLLHEGLSLRESIEPSAATSGRTKIDQLSIFQGPVFYAEYRRIAKILKNSLSDADRASLGGPDHCEVNLFANPLTGLERMRRLSGYMDSNAGVCGDDQLTTIDFLQALLGKIPVEDVLSPVKDHLLSIKLLSAAYESAAASFQASRPSPVFVDFLSADALGEDSYWRHLPPTNGFLHAFGG